MGGSPPHWGIPSPLGIIFSECVGGGASLNIYIFSFLEEAELNFMPLFFLGLGEETGSIPNLEYGANE